MIILSAGVPNWQRLFDLGRLPKSARKFIFGLSEIDRIKKLMCDDCKEKIFGKKEEKNQKPKEKEDEKK